MSLGGAWKALIYFIVYLSLFFIFSESLWNSLRKRACFIEAWTKWWDNWQVKLESYSNFRIMPCIIFALTKSLSIRVYLLFSKYQYISTSRFSRFLRPESLPLVFDNASIVYPDLFYASPAFQLNYTLNSSYPNHRIVVILPAPGRWYAASFLIPVKTEKTSRPIRQKVVQYLSSFSLCKRGFLP